VRPAKSKKEGGNPMVVTSDPFFHIYAAIFIILVGFVLIEVRRLHKAMKEK
jgi:hypothetical protein